ncbi:MAG: glycosyltransferase [Candidatus Tantalella remota]|nr:glycosyltransferase [Candidatus Tantalella remota]
MKHECDIVLLSYESPKLLKRCVKSVLEGTCVPSRLIIVDNASTEPEVKKYIMDVKGNETVSIEKVFSPENAGFAAGMNKGLRLSDAPFVCILNNDCVVADGWIEEMLNVALSRDDIGLVNPQSNTFGSRPDKGISINDHASLIRDRKGKFVELGHAIGFACLIKKEVIDRIGYLDEAYEGVCYEDTDFAAKAYEKGFISVMAEGSYVFHEEQASRKNLKGKEEIYLRNRTIFEDRWGRLLRVFFIDRTPVSEGNMPEQYEVLKALARERALIHMWVRQDLPAKRAFAEFDRRKITRHADIGMTFLSGKNISLKILWKVLTKKKKYDAVIMEKGVLFKVLRMLKPLHGTEIFSREEGMCAVSASGETFELENPASFAAALRSGR